MTWQYYGNWLRADAKMGDDVVDDRIKSNDNDYDNDDDDGF